MNSHSRSRILYTSAERAAPPAGLVELKTKNSQLDAQEAGEFPYWAQWPRNNSGPDDIPCLPCSTSLKLTSIFFPFFSSS